MRDNNKPASGDQTRFNEPNWGNRPEGTANYWLPDIPLSVTPNDITYSVPSNLGTTTTTNTYSGTVTESRSRDWGHHYKIETNLVDGEWTNTASGHTFQKGAVDFKAIRTEGVNSSYAIPANTSVGYQNSLAVTGTASSAYLSTTTSVWHKDYDQKLEYVLAQDNVNDVTAWVPSVFHDERHATSSVTYDQSYDASWHYTADSVLDYGEHSWSQGSMNHDLDETFTSMD